jgi:hypothetical protein
MSLSFGNHFRLERADHVAVVARCEATTLRDLFRECVELVPRLHEAHERLLHEVAGIRAHAEAAQVVRIDLGRQLVRLACARHYVLLHPRRVLLELRVEQCQVFLPALDAAALEILADAVDEALTVVEALLHLDRSRARSVPPCRSVRRDAPA